MGIFGYVEKYEENFFAAFVVFARFFSADNFKSDHARID